MKKKKCSGVTAESCLTLNVPAWLMRKRGTQVAVCANVF